MSDLRFCGKNAWETSDFRQNRKKTEEFFLSGLEIGKNSCPTPVARGGSEAKAPPLAARPVPRNGRGRRLVELTNGC